MRRWLDRVRQDVAYTLRSARRDLAFVVVAVATDATTYVQMVAVLAVVALLAGYIPARRASRINPIDALRT